METSKTDLNIQIQYILGKLNEEYEVAKEKGFPSKGRFNDADAVIAPQRWSLWQQELGIDHGRFGDILDILQKRGFIRRSEFISEFM